ncbi:MAG: PTS sugar transporter subunit IIB [Faecalibacillus sp.]
MYKILLCCASGVTTNMLVSSIKESAKKEGKSIMCWAVGALSLQFSWADADCVLVAPQSKADFKQIHDMIHGVIPCEMMKEEDFIKMDGDAILNHAIELIENNKK